MKPVKIFEIKGSDWMRGFSKQTSSTLGGLFSLATNFDPFEKNGICQPSMANTAVASTGTSTNYLTPFSSGGAGYMYAHGSTKLYQITTGNQSVSDVTGSITTGAISGAGVWKGRYLYALDTEIRSIVLGAGTDASVLTGLTSSVPHNMCTGPDQNQYVTNGVNIAKLILESGTAGNATTSSYSLEQGQVAKDIATDGRYMVIISDNNSAQATTSKAKCVITFWDAATGAGTAIAQYEVDDAYLIAVKVINGVTHVIGRNSLWVCNVNSAPQAVYNFTGNAVITGGPTSTSQVCVSQGVLYWGDTATGRIYGYGNRIDQSKKVFFCPFSVASGTIQALANSGTIFWASSSTPSVYALNIGSTRTSANLQVAPIDFGSRYQFSHVKVVFNGFLASGESIAVGLGSADGNGITSASETKTFASEGARQTLLFFKNPSNTSNDVIDFEELSYINITVGKQPIKRLSVWAYPIEDQYQT